MEIKEITVKQLKEMMDKNKSFQLIDVREPNEYQFCNIGGELIPMGQIDQHKDKIKKDRPVIMQCRSGKRSGDVVVHLQQEGFDNLYNLAGGILAWSDEIDPAIPKY